MCSTVLPLVAIEMKVMMMRIEMMMIMDDEYGGFLICNFVSYYKFMLKNFPLHFSLL